LLDSDAFFLIDKRREKVKAFLAELLVYSPVYIQ